MMFCDLVGSTALSARMDPEDLREIISAYQKSVAETVQRYSGCPTTLDLLPALSRPIVQAAPACAFREDLRACRKRAPASNARV